MARKKTILSLPKLQEYLFTYPEKGITTVIKKIYKENNTNSLGWPTLEKRLFEDLARKNTCSIIGIALGDEGKGRFIDNKIETMLKKPGVKHVTVVRYQGGNNAGHSIEKDGKKIDVHLLPSSVLYKNAQGIMDRGMIIHPEDLKTEVTYIEKIVGSLNGKLYLSVDAILSTDLERAEEVINREKTGKAKGGTGRGIGPSYAHHYDRLGLKMYDLLDRNWRKTLSSYYDRYQKEFAAFGVKLKDVEVPDFNISHKTKRSVTRTVGTKEVFLKRLGNSRSWLIKRKMSINTFPLHQKLYEAKNEAMLFEGAQAAGLDAWIGTHPDVTASNTSVYGIRDGTGFWRVQDIEERIGIFKITYNSSVGARRMPTHVDLPKDLKDLKNPTPDQEWAAFVRVTAHEFGTTTGRPRDITFLDLPFLMYNARMSGVEALAGTHLDISTEDRKIKVCTHYTNKKGYYIPYQPGLRYQEDVIPHYVELPGWNGDDCKKAKTIKDLPKNARNFLAFIEKRTGFPIVAVTTGYERNAFLALPGYLS
jgi:adenylosuccinate synthase